MGWREVNKTSTEEKGEFVYILENGNLYIGKFKGINPSRLSDSDQ